MANALVTGPFVAMEAIIQLSYELEGTQVLAKAIKRNHIKRFYRGELPRAGFEMAHQVVTCGIAMTFLRFFDIRKRQMINRLQVLGAVRH